MNALELFWQKLRTESEQAYRASRFSALSQDYLGRFWRDAHVTRNADEIEIDNTWAICADASAGELGSFMAECLADFLTRCMQVRVPVTTDSARVAHTIVLAIEPADNDDPQAFTIDIQPNLVRLTAASRDGIRDGVVKLIDLMGMRRAPQVQQGSTTYMPRVRTRLGAVPYLGSLADVAYYGYNAVDIEGGDLFIFSRSTAIKPLIARQQPDALARLKAQAREAARFALRPYVRLTTAKFAKDDPLFDTHPDLRGALTWKADGLHVLCTEHPLMQQYLRESTIALFEDLPNLAGLYVIVGGEGFYHCFMRPHGVEKGHTNCPRCEAIGPETVVANMVNRMAEAARSVRPDAHVLAWPYSAVHVWSRDSAELPFIERLGPGAGLFTEMEKDEIVKTPLGVDKHLWDYSTHLVGPGDRARKQIDACRRVGVPAHVKSESELSFEAARLAHMPSMDLWLARAHAMATCGASGAWVFPAFRPMYGCSAAEVYKHAWFEPTAPSEHTLDQLAARIAGQTAGPALRRAWKHVSDALIFAPELPPYYTGPCYLGPAHPMCADPNANPPEVFHGRYLFHSEIKPEDGLRLQPTFDRSPRRATPPFEASYQRMAQLLAEAASEIESVRDDVPSAARLMFDAEASSILWFYHTCRTMVNFYASCHQRDALLGEKNASLDAAERGNRVREWREVLQDELANTQAALPLAEDDVRLDCYFGGDHCFSHMADMVRAKLQLLTHEIEVFLPIVANA